MLIRRFHVKTKVKHSFRKCKSADRNILIKLKSPLNQPNLSADQHHLHLSQTTKSTWKKCLTSSGISQKEKMIMVKLHLIINLIRRVLEIIKVMVKPRMVGLRMGMIRMRRIIKGRTRLRRSKRIRVWWQRRKISRIKVNLI